MVSRSFKYSDLVYGAKPEKKKRRIIEFDFCWENILIFILTLILIVLSGAGVFTIWAAALTPHDTQTAQTEQVDSTDNTTVEVAGTSYSGMLNAVSPMFIVLSVLLTGLLAAAVGFVIWFVVTEILLI